MKQKEIEEHLTNYLWNYENEKGERLFYSKFYAQRLAKYLIMRYKIIVD